MHGKSRVSSAIKYDCFKLNDSGNCIIRKTWLHCIRLNEVIPRCTRSVNCRLVCSILMNTMLMNIL